MPIPATQRDAIVRTVRIPAVLAGLVLAAYGCTSASQRTTAPYVVPSAWSVTDVSATGGTASLARWWLRFDDPLLARLVAQALQANTSVRSAEAALRQARALRDVSAAALWPGVGSSASAQRAMAGGHSTGNTFRAGLDATWELDIFRANRSALEASEANAAASAASLGEVQVSIAAEVALAYVTLRNAQVRAAIAEANLASQLETLQITRWREQAGLVSNLDAEQASATAEQTRAQLPALRTAIEQAGHALAVLTGQPPAVLSAVLATPGPVPQAPDSLSLGIPAETLRQRPDVRAAEYQVTAAVARVSQAGAALAPNFQIGGSIGLASATLDTLANRASLVGALLASVSMPVFDAGALRAQVRSQQAALDQAYAAYDAAVLTALQEVEDALIALRGDRERLVSLRRAAESAANAAQLASQRYRSGLIDFQTVLDTQRTQLSTQDSVASANADLSADHVRLYKALGGGWLPDADAAPRADRNAGQGSPS